MKITKNTLPSEINGIGEVQFDDGSSVSSNDTKKVQTPPNEIVVPVTTNNTNDPSTNNVIPQSSSKTTTSTSTSSSTTAAASTTTTTSVTKKGTSSIPESNLPNIESQIVIKDAINPDANGHTHILNYLTGEKRIENVPPGYNADDNTVTISKNNFNEAYGVLRPLQDYEMLRSPTNDIRQISMINRFGIPLPDGKLRTRGFIFMTRPNLNLFKTTKNDINGYEADCQHPNDDLAKLPTFGYIWNLGQNEFQDSSNVNLGRRIYLSLSNFTSRKSVNPVMLSNDTYPHTSPWLSIITNQAKDYPVISREMDTVELGQTYHGNKVVYAEPTFTYKIANKITINFADRRDLSLYYTLKLWIEYIQAVSTGLASPYRSYIIDSVLDYAVSMYYVVTDETMENILYWEKLTGVFPTNIPDDIWSSKKSFEDMDLEYSVTFQYSFRSVQHENHLMEINALYDVNSDNSRISIGNMQVGVSQNGYARTYNSYYLSNTAHPNVGFKKRGASDWDSLMRGVRSFYGKNSGKYVDKYYCDSIHGGEAEFYPNWLTLEQMHGIPYVNGPYITLGTSVPNNVALQTGFSTENDENDTRNQSQYKLRWI